MLKLSFRLELNMEMPQSESGAIGSASAATSASQEQVLNYKSPSYRTNSTNIYRTDFCAEENYKHYCMGIIKYDVLIESKTKYGLIVLCRKSHASSKLNPLKSFTN